MCLGEPALRRTGLTHVSEESKFDREHSPFPQGKTLPFTSVLAAYAPVTASGVDCGITSPALISLEDKTYN